MKRKDLTEVDKALWNKIAKTVKPLKNTKKAIIPKPLKQSGPPPKPAPIFPAPSTPFSNHRIERIRKVRIEARLDLHGLTRIEAHAQLLRFLTRCQRHGFLWVLVITGKGRREKNEDGFYSAPALGVLQKLVPEWLDELSSRNLVSAYAAAKPQDGGSGAIYVRLKRFR